MPSRAIAGIARLALASALLAAPAAAEIFPLESEIQEFQLDNGLRFIVVERPFAPVFSFVTLFDVGGSDEPAGLTGIAHMMEHMAFKGSPLIGTEDATAEERALRRVDEAWEVVREQRRLGIVGRADSLLLERALTEFRVAQEEANRLCDSNAFSRWLEENGAQNLNAFTSADMTAYFYDLPSNKLELWGVLEGNRMTYPVFREFYQERDVIIEERRIGTESSPRGRLVEKTWQAAFTAHPYRNGVIGFRSDIENFSRADAEKFFREHYNAANMVVVVVGDVRFDEVRRVAERYFSAIPSGPKSLPVGTVEPPPDAERFVRTFETAQPLVIAAYHGGPAFTDPNYLGVDALLDILASGRSSRLYTSLVKERRLATSVSGRPGFPGSKYPNLVWFNLTPAPGVSPDDLLAALQEELDGLAARPITAEELQGYRNRARTSFVSGLRGNNGLAFQLAYYQTRMGDWRHLFRRLERIERVTTEEVDREAARIFRRTNRTVGIMETRAADQRQEGSS